MLKTSSQAFLGKEKQIESLRNDLWNHLEKTGLEAYVSGVKEICNKYENDGQPYMAVLTFRQLAQRKLEKILAFSSPEIPIKVIDQNSFHDKKPGERLKAMVVS